MKRKFQFNFVVSTMYGDDENHPFEVFAWTKLGAYSKAARHCESYMLVDGREAYKTRLDFPERKKPLATGEAVFWFVVLTVLVAAPMVGVHYAGKAVGIWLRQ